MQRGARAAQRGARPAGASVARRTAGASWSTRSHATSAAVPSERASRACPASPAPWAPSERTPCRDASSALVRLRCSE